MKPSERFTLNSADIQKIFKDALYFFLVPLTFYITAVLGVIQLPNHILSLHDFVPSNSTNIAVVTWLLSQALNTTRKFVAGK